MAIRSVTNSFRLKKLQNILSNASITRIIEVHSPLAAVLAEHAWYSNRLRVRWELHKF